MALASDDLQLINVNIYIQGKIREYFHGIMFVINACEEKKYFNTLAERLTYSMSINKPSATFPIA
jgi:hypothetical protein